MRSYALRLVRSIASCRPKLTWITSHLDVGDSQLFDEPGSVQNTPCSELPPCPLFHSAAQKPVFCGVQEPPFFHTFHSSPSSSRTVGAYWIEMLSPMRSALRLPWTGGGAESPQ